MMLLRLKKWMIQAVILTSMLTLPSTVWGQNFSNASQAEEGQVSEEPEIIPGDAATDEQILALAHNTVLMGDESSTYTLGPDDVIEIKVMRHPEVSGQFQITNDGKIQYSFVGDIEVAGMNKEEAVESLKKILAEYIVNPQLSLTILEYNSKLVYVVGEVGRPGKIIMRGDTITVLEALIEAGLPLLSGITKKSRLITPSDTGRGSRRDVNIHALLYDGDLRENLVMNPGDVLYIPPTFLTKTMRAIQPVTAPVSNAAGGARSVYTGGI